MDNTNPIKTVLIVEDDLILSKALVEKFRSVNFAVLTALNGDEGLKMAYSQHPNIIILDLLMPIKDGMVFMEEIRKDSWGKTVPVVILTNLDANDFMLSKLPEYQPAYYLIKSNTNIENVIEKARDLLND